MTAHVTPVPTGATGPRRARPLSDTLEVRAPGLTSFVMRLLLRLPPAVRRRVLVDAFSRAERAFNRADFETVFALFAKDVEYVPPRSLYSGPPIVGHDAVLNFWREQSARYPESHIRNLNVEEITSARFVRLAELSHQGEGGRLVYVIRQTTDVRKGRVVRQVNEELSPEGLGRTRDLR